VVEVFNGVPSITCYALEKDAMDAFEAILKEQIKVMMRVTAESILEQAISTKFYEKRDYTIRVVKTNLIG
jgi:hypothetical protein